jgi:hypothetical protein
VRIASERVVTGVAFARIRTITMHLDLGNHLPISTSTASDGDFFVPSDR